MPVYNKLVRKEKQESISAMRGVISSHDQTLRAFECTADIPHSHVLVGNILPTTTAHPGAWHGTARDFHASFPLTMYRDKICVRRFDLRQDDGNAVMMLERNERTANKPIYTYTARAQPY